MFKRKNLLKRITAVASAAVIYTASMCGTFLGSPMEKFSLQNTIVAEAASVLDGAGYITSNSALQKDRWYKSPNGNYGLIFQSSDGNLVIYHFKNDGNRTPYWASGTNRCDADLCQIQSDGNFVIYDKYKRPVWTTDSYQTPASLYINNNGELFIYSRKIRGKVWSSKYSSNPNGTRIYQEPKNEPQKPVHTCRYMCYCDVKDHHWYYGCPDCHSHDHEVGITEYIQRSGKTVEEAVERYFELIGGYDSTKIKAIASAYSSLSGLDVPRVRNELTKLDDFDTNLLPDCKTKDYIETYQENIDKAKAILDIYDLFKDAKNNTIGIDDVERMINGLSLAFNGLPLAKETYGNVLEGMKDPAKKAILAGLKHNYNFTFNGLPTTWTGSEKEAGSYCFWDTGVTAYDLRCQRPFEFGNGILTVEDYFEKIFDTKSQAKDAYKVFKNLKCLQEVTGEPFWELVNEFFG